MRHPRTLPMVSVCAGLLIAATNVHAWTFRDSFESKDLLTTDANGFKWEGPNRTSVVTQSPKDGPVAVYNGKVIYNIHDPKMPDGTVRDWTAMDGDYSLRFRYPAGQPWAEQRFRLGTPQRDLWLRYWIRVPTNYTHGTIGTTGAVNNKFFSIWMDGYEAKGTGSTFWLSMESAGGGDTNLAFTYTSGKNTGSKGMQQHTPFIKASSDRGRWMQIVIHLKAEASQGSSDGVIQVWRRWEGESKFMLFHEKLDTPFRFPDTGPNGFAVGYLMGWANGAYASDTEWLLDDFTISTDNLLEIGKVALKPRPQPPSMKSASAF